MSTYPTVLPSIAGQEAKVTVLDAEVECRRLTIDVRRRDAIETVGA